MSDFLESSDLKWQLFKLTLLQGAMIVLGFIVFLSVKSIYQQHIMNEAFSEDLRKSIIADFEGREHAPKNSRFILSLIALPLILVIGQNAASLFFRASKKRRQTKRDIKARMLLRSFYGGSVRDFSLYLRSFSDDNRLRRKKSIWWYIFLEGDLFAHEWESIELKLSQVVRNSFPMISVGAARKSLGSGKLQSSDTKGEWKELASLLMDKASIIFVIPSTTKGVLWEIEQLKDLMWQGFSGHTKFKLGKLHNFVSGKPLPHQSVRQAHGLYRCHVQSHPQCGAPIALLVASTGMFS
ncbi:MAG: hypothetical protein HQL53_11640 [Magnetococcales bacterium]|nr:hypothetical protein [Magnetococcales bacterium]